MCCKMTQLSASFPLLKLCPPKVCGMDDIPVATSIDRPTPQATVSTCPMLRGAFSWKFAPLKQRISRKSKLLELIIRTRMATSEMAIVAKSI